MTSPNSDMELRYSSPLSRSHNSTPISPSQANLRTTIFMYHGTLVLLGDEGTGKTIIHRNLQLYNPEKINDNYEMDEIQFSRDDIINAFATDQQLYDSFDDKNHVRIRVKEMNKVDIQGYDKSIAQMYSETLFTVITLNLMDRTTANTAFNHYMAFRDKYMPHSYTFVLGTHTSSSEEYLALHRQVDFNAITKACAQKDSIYHEVSVFPNEKIEEYAIIRKIMSQQIGFLIKSRKVINLYQFIDKRRTPTENNMEATGMGYQDNLQSIEDSKGRNYDLVPRKVCSSTGRIHKSVLDINMWKGLDNDNDTLKNDINNLFKSLEDLQQSVDEYCQNAFYESQDSHETQFSPIKDDIIGNSNLKYPLNSNSLKVSGSYNIDKHILSNENELAPTTSIEDIIQDIQKVNESTSYISSKTCKVRAQVPTISSDSTTKQVIEIVIKKGDDLKNIIANLKKTYSLNLDQESKLFNVLLSACNKTSIK